MRRTWNFVRRKVEIAHLTKLRIQSIISWCCSMPQIHLELSKHLSHKKHERHIDLYTGAHFSLLPTRVSSFPPQQQLSPWTGQLVRGPS